MKKKYAILAGVSAFALCFGLLTGCGKKNEEPQEEPEIIQEETQAEHEIVDDAIVEENVQDGEEMPAQDGEQESEDADAAVPAEQTVLVAELTELAEDGSMHVVPFELADETADAAIEDYANVDFSGYVAQEQVQELALAEDAVFFLADNGELVEADAETLAVGCMLIVVTENNGVQFVVIYAPAE